VRGQANTRISLFFFGAALLAMTSFAISANAQLDQQVHAALTAPIEPMRPGVSEVQIFDELLAHNALRSATLLNYTALRTYRVVDLQGKVHAEEVGRMEYLAPDQKKFVVTSEKGSVMVRRLALNPLIASGLGLARKAPNALISSVLANSMNCSPCASLPRMNSGTCNWMR